ncbi:transposase [Xanthomonas perforans]|nr:transposase [Xanthomonas perforans]
MNKSTFIEEQMVRSLEEVEAVAKVGETCRKHGSASRPNYVRKSKLAGM